MRHTLFSLVLSTLLLLMGCTPMDTIEIAPVYYKVLQSGDTDFSDIKKFNPILEDFSSLLFFLDKSISIRITALEYDTVDPFGQPIRASGLVLHPLNKKSKGVIEVLPHARIGGEGASAEFYSAEGLLAFSGYTVIVPDLLGFGVSREAVRSPFLMSEITGKVAYDMRLAAIRFLWEEFKYALPSQTILMGYSLGGSAAVATQKYYETNHSNAVKVKEVYAGGGAYDLNAAFSAYARDEFSTYPAIPNTILAFNHFYNLDLDFSQIFTGTLLENYDAWYNGVINTRFLENLSLNLRDYMHEDFFKPFNLQNEEFKKLHPLLTLNSVSQGWRPKATIYLTHATEDTHVPVECADAAVKNWRRAGANVVYYRYPGHHESVASVYFLRNLLSF